MKSLLTLLSLATSIFLSANARASVEPCNLDDGEAALLKCYQDEFQEKQKTNEVRFKEFIAQVKTEIQTAAESEKRSKVEALADIGRKAHHSFHSNRRTAAFTCARMAAKIQSDATAEIAIINCRSSHEVSLANDLRRLELQLDLLESTKKIQQIKRSQK